MADRAPRGALVTAVSVVLVTVAAIVTAWSTGSWSPAKQLKPRASSIPNVVHEELTSAERSVVAAGFTYRVWPGR